MTHATWVGIGLSVVTLIAVRPLAAAKRRVGTALGYSATARESRESMLRAYLSAALLVGLLADAVAGWWWADGRRAADRRGRVPRGPRRLARETPRLLLAAPYPRPGRESVQANQPSELRTADTRVS